MKKLRYCWSKNDKYFCSVSGKVKKQFAHELLLFDHIKAPYSDKYFIEYDPAKYLELHGWKWIRCKDSHKHD